MEKQAGWIFALAQIHTKAKTKGALNVPTVPGNPLAAVKPGQKGMVRVGDKVYEVG